MVVVVRLWDAPVTPRNLCSTVFFVARKLRGGDIRVEGSGWVGRKGIHEMDIPTHSIQYQPKMFNTEPEYSMLAQSIQYQGMSMHSVQLTIFEQYS